MYDTWQSRHTYLYCIAQLTIYILVIVLSNTFDNSTYILPYAILNYFFKTIFQNVFRFVS